MELAGGGRVVVKSGDVVVGRGNDQPLAYRGKDGTFVPAADGGWVGVKNVRPADYEAWLASANSKFEAARSLYDIAARYRPEPCRGWRLDKVPDRGIGPDDVAWLGR